MAVTIANIIRNHRGLYFEATGDGATVALTVSHNATVHAGTTATATVRTAASSFVNGHSNKGGFVFPAVGTDATVSSVTVSATSVTVTPSAAIANATKAYVSVVFDQDSASL